MKSIKEIKTAELEQEVNLNFEEKIVDSNGSIRMLKFRDCSGRLVVFRCNWDTLTVSVEEKPEILEKFIVFGTTNNGLVEVSKMFEEKEKAEDAIQKAQCRDSSAQLEIKTILVEKE
jgi:Ca2+-binding EF-hand superfamily protein